MTDMISNSTISAGRSTHIVFGAVVTAFCLGLIAFIVLEGSPTNSLHTSALAWSFATVGVVMASFGFPAAVQLIKS